MNSSIPNSGASLTLRRDALLAECARQRTTLATETENLRHPFEGRNLRQTLRQTLLGKLKLPLVIAGAGLGMLVAKPRRLLACAQSGAAMLVKGAGLLAPLLSVLKRTIAR